MKNADGKANAMNAAWGGIVGMDEVIIDLSQHKTTENIMVNQAFTVIDGGKYLGKIKNVSVDKRVLGEDGQISLDKFSLITFDTVHYAYYRLGEKVGNAFKDGEKLK